MRIIAGEWRGRRLAPVRSPRVRPTTDRVREAWMSALGDSIVDARVLDLFAGSGALGLEALSRGASEAVFVDRSAGALRTLRRNIETVGAGERCSVVRGDAIAYAEGAPERSFGVAFADPPYERGLACELVRLFERHPFALQLWVEHRWAEDMPDYPGLRTRRYGDTAITTLAADS